MTTKTSVGRRWMRGPAVLWLGLLCAVAWAAPGLEPQLSGSTPYLSGGIGLDEAQAIQEEARRWPLTLEFAARPGQATRNVFIADVRVHVSDAQGRVVLDAVSEGPFLLARLDPGRYEVRATFAGSTQTRRLTLVADRPARLLFLWHTDADQPVESATDAASPAGAAHRL